MMLCNVPRNTSSENIEGGRVSELAGFVDAECEKLRLPNPSQRLAETAGARAGRHRVIIAASLSGDNYSVRKEVKRRGVTAGCKRGMLRCW
jgi:hypothetical protein